MHKENQRPEHMPSHAHLENLVYKTVEILPFLSKWAFLWRISILINESSFTYSAFHLINIFFHGFPLSSQEFFFSHTRHKTFFLLFRLKRKHNPYVFMSEQTKSSWSASPASSDFLSGAHTTFSGNKVHMAREARKALGRKGRVWMRFQG